jgi:4a-hydroxytetrahydrobiopterin dehydratase
MAKSKLTALTGPEIQKRLPELHGWRLSRGALRCEFRFESFRKALQFVNKVGGLAEAADHHPDIDIRFNVVKLALSTHDVSGVSARDFSLARSIDGQSLAQKSV